MTGSKQYNVTINGIKQKVTGNSFEATLSTGLSIIRVDTDLECQGFVEKEVFISEDIHYYPNPTDSDVKVHVGGEDTCLLYTSPSPRDGDESRMPSSA